MKLAFLYAGQGSQHQGMGQDLYESSAPFREAFDAANLPFDLHQVCFQDPSKVHETRYTQPCMVAMACGITAALFAEGIVPEAAAGLSLGEYSALAAAGVFDWKTAVEVAAFRGEAMTKAAAGLSSGMTAVIGLDREKLEDCCRKASPLGVVEICNDNCPGQLVIGGESAAVNCAAELAKDQGAKRCLPLKVSGPFHTSLMAPAGLALQEHFKHMTFGEMRFPVLFNCLGRERGIENIPELLVRQVQIGVRMRETLLRLSEMGIDTFLEIGPGTALSGFVRRTVPGALCLNVENSEQLAEVLVKLKEAGYGKA